MLNTITNYNDRITLGKQQEARIIDFLKTKGYNIQLPTASEDKYDKIDGWFLPKSGGKLSFQLKFREGGDDLPFELIRDWDRNIEGRDLISKAQLYVVVNRSGRLSIYKTSEIKAKAQELLKLADENPVDQKGSGFDLKFTIDKANGANKVMLFFNPLLFKSVASYVIPDYD